MMEILESFFVRLGWVLVHSLWQGTLIAVFCVLLAKRVSRPVVSHLILMGGMLGFFVAAIATFVRADAPTLREGLFLEGEMLDVLAPEIVVTAMELNQPLGGVQWEWCVGTLWMIGGLFTLIRAVYGQWQVRGWRQGAHPAGGEKLEAAIRRARSQVAGSRRVAVLVSDRVISPMIYGVLQPTIFIPLSVSARFSARELELIVLHELMHWKRLDVWMHGVQVWLRVLFYYHPAYWWLARLADQAREEATDDAVLRLGAERQEYASVLAGLVELGIGGDGALGCHATAGSHVAHRIRRFMISNPTSKVGPSCKGGVVIMSVVFALGLALGVANTTTTEGTSVLRSPSSPEEYRQVLNELNSAYLKANEVFYQKYKGNAEEMEKQDKSLFNDRIYKRAAYNKLGAQFAEDFPAEATLQHHILKINLENSKDRDEPNGQKEQRYRDTITNLELNKEDTQYLLHHMLRIIYRKDYVNAQRIYQEVVGVDSEGKIINSSKEVLDDIKKTHERGTK